MLETRGQVNDVAEILSAETEKAEDGGYRLPENRNDLGVKESSCNLDSINRFPKSSRENIFLRDSRGNYIVETADKKGHEVRNMLVYHDHGVIPQPEDFDYENVSGNMFEDFLELTASQIRNNDQVEDKMALIIGLTSEPRHYHLIASDLDGGNPAEIQDLEEVNNYIYWDLSDEFKPEEPESMRFGDKRSIGLEPFYSNVIE